MKIKVNKLECKRCGHKWIARKDEVMVCAKCHSPYWNRTKDEGRNETKTIMSEFV